MPTSECIGMKILSVAFTIFLILAATRLAAALRKAGALPVKDETPQPVIAGRNDSVHSGLALYPAVDQRQFN